MRVSVVSLLIVSLVAVSASESEKVDKRSVLAGHGNGLDAVAGLSSAVSFGTSGLGSSAKYLPPVSTLSVIKKPTVAVSSIPTASYGIPAASYGVPAASYGVPAASYGVPAAIPSYYANAPLHTYGVPAVASIPSYSVPAPVPVVSSYAPVATLPSYSSIPVSTSTYGLASFPSATSYGYASPSVSLSSYPISAGSSLHGGIGLASAAVPSTVVETVPSAGVSLGTVGVNKYYGAPAYATGSGLALGVPSKSYGVPVVSHGGLSSGLATGSVGLSSGSVGLSTSSLGLGPSATYGVPSTSVHVGHDDGYSYPVPHKKLIV